MCKELSARLLALCLAAGALLCACAPSQQPPGVRTEDTALSWTSWSGYEPFLELAARTCPDIQLELTPYAGANRTGYSWAQMRGDDIPDIFITSQILDPELAKQRLVDLSSHDFVNSLSTALLDQVAIDGGVYLLPVNNAMYGIYYNKTLMEERGWQVPASFAELKQLCAQIRQAGLIPGVIGTELPGNSFSAVFNLAKTSWLTTPEGVAWEQDFLSGRASAAGMWERTMDYVQQYIDIGMFETDPGGMSNADLVREYLGGRRAVFCTASWTASAARLESGDELGLMPYISQDGSKNVYMYSPSSYIGISSRLTQPGNERRLEQALELLTLLFSPEGQEVLLAEHTPCMLSVLNRAEVPEEALIYSAHLAMDEGRAFPMTYARWEGVLSDMGQAFTQWFRGEQGMDGARCIARMDELQRDYLNHQESVYFCQSTADFTLEQTARLVGQALCSETGADAAMVLYSQTRRPEVRLTMGITGKLYQGRINAEVSTSIAPGEDGQYAILTMTGAQARQLEQEGFDLLEDGQPFPYLLAVSGGGVLEDDRTYQVAFLMDSYTRQTGERFQARVEKGSVRAFLRSWLTGQKTVSPDQYP